jgi:predicted amino acid racemase
VWKRALPKEIIALGVRDFPHQQFKIIKTLDQTLKTVYISHLQKKHRKYCSLCWCEVNTEIYTIQELSKEAQKQNKIHKIIIMIEVIYVGSNGRRIDWVLRQILSLPNIEIRGIGTNLNCLSGIMLRRINWFN